jgi:ferredoxin
MTLMTVLVRFLPDDIAIEAQVGELLLDVAERAGVFIPTGCLMGSCGACEVELEERGEIRCCITSVPPGQSSLTISLFSDPTW